MRLTCFFVLATSSAFAVDFVREVRPIFEKHCYECHGPEKQKVMDQMVAIVREDAPWAWGYWPYVALAFQPWAHNGKPSIVVRDLAKYYRIDPALRVARQAEWNQPVRWPLALIALALIAMVLAAWRGYRARQQATAKPKNAAPATV